MSFGKTAGNILLEGTRFLIEKTNAMNDEFMQYKDEYDKYTDEELVRRYTSSSGVKKMACIALLKERGYFQNGED